MTCTFVSDIHLNLRHNKQWEENRFLLLFDYLASSTSDTIILGGDIFDLAKPSLEEIGIFYKGISKLTSAQKKVYLISGNHENLSEEKTVFNHIPQVGYEYLEKGVINVGKYSMYFVSHLFCKQISDFKPDIKSNRVNVLFSHFRSNYGTFIKGEIDVKEVSEMFDHVFVGDIHHLYSPFPNVLYPSSPYSVHYELLRDYGVYEITFGDTLTFEHKLLHLPSKVLHHVSASDVLEGLSLDGDHLYKIIVKGNPDTRISTMLMKNPKVATFDYIPEIVEDTEEFEQLVEDLSSHIEEDVVSTLVLLLKANEYPLTEPLETYLRKVLTDARN